MKNVTGAEDAVARLWNPGTVALIGASSRPGTLAWWPQRLMQQFGFAGRVIPVNPNRAEIEGLPCAPSIGAIEGPVDVAVVTLDNLGTARAVAECAAAGVGAVILPAQGFGESGDEGKAIERGMLEVARSAGMRIHGPNTDGLANFATGAVMSIQPVLGQGVDVGEVAVITQSGATAGSLISRLKAEGIGCRLYASAGNEIDLGLADYLSVALQDPNVKMVLSFIEAIRRPEDFVKVAALAAELGKPIVVIKVGRTREAAARAAAHTGALAGEDRIYDALFDSLGIVRVEELSELVAIAKLHLATGAIASNRIGIMSVSGGQAGTLADRAASFGLRLPELAPYTQDALSSLFPHGNALNPCDLTGDIAKKPELAAAAYAVFDDDASVDFLVYARKNLTGDVGQQSVEALAMERSKRRLPLAVYSMDGVVNELESKIYHSQGIPIFTSASELFAGVRGLAKFNARPAVRAIANNVEPVASIPSDASGVLSDEHAKSLLGAYGISFPAERVVTDAATAVETAEAIGYPVTLKIVSERITHKTEVGGVLLGVSGESAVREGFALLMERGRTALAGDDPEGILIQEQITDGVEIITGLVIDEQFGPFVLVGTGGVMAELLDDAVLRPAPVTAAEAREMIGTLRGRALLTGFRGAPPADIDALAETISSLSRLGRDHAEVISELDLNPVLVRPAGRGAVAVDALVVLSERVRG
ncbi:acetate--CoA ligase family protein [Specibacter sp. RAF43]|uniref:acetate--CoA ligase family protein n=1 Tax=Specibacter sp. RAF43 TaxID=3233057 RepID=UPI003F953F45